MFLVENGKTNVIKSAFVNGDHDRIIETMDARIKTSGKELNYGDRQAPPSLW